MTVPSGALGRGLALAASPTFVLMAGLAAVDSAAVSLICGGGTGLSALTGMPAMYLLMSVFHVGPWLRLAAG
ncbi:MAG: hypothetical protein ACFCVH_06775 [Alphaproteobacteria bacterium]